MDQILNFRNAEACRKSFINEQLRGISLNDFSGVSLAGLLEAYFSCLHSSSKNRETFANTSQECSVELWNLLNRVKSNSERQLLAIKQKPRPVEFYSLRQEGMHDPQSLSRLGFYLFQERFALAAKGCGFKTLGRVLSAVMQELVDNVAQHSEILSNSDGNGIVGFHTETGYLSFSVIDSGCGILESLHSSPAWACLNTDEDALRAVVFQNASRKGGLGKGEGFKELFRCLIDRNISLRIRAGSASVTIQQSKEKREALFASSPNLKGLHVTLTCCREGVPAEKIIKIEQALDSLTEFGY